MEKKAQKEKVNCEAEQQTQVLYYIDCVVIELMFTDAGRVLDYREGAI